MRVAVSIIAVFAILLTPQFAFAHCEIPCGIYGDDGRFAAACSLNHHALRERERQGASVYGAVTFFPETNVTQRSYDARITYNATAVHGAPLWLAL